MSEIFEKWVVSKNEFDYFSKVISETSHGFEITESELDEF